MSDTLIVLEVDDDDECSRAFLLFVPEATHVVCPELTWGLICKPVGDVAQSFQEMSNEIVERALSALEDDSIAKRCLYISPRAIVTEVGEDEYILYALLITVVERSKKCRRYFAPLFEDDAPWEEINATLQPYLDEVRDKSPFEPIKDGAGVELADTLTQAVLSAYRMGSEYLLSARQ